MTQDFFTHLLDMRTQWQKTGTAGVLEGHRPHHRRPEVDRHHGRPRVWQQLQLRALAEVYAAADASAKFEADFVAAWVKVMELDRFDLR